MTDVHEFVAERIALHGTRWREILAEVKTAFGDKYPGIMHVSRDTFRVAFRDSQAAGDVSSFGSLISAKEQLTAQVKRLQNARDQWRELLLAEVIPFKTFKTPRPPSDTAKRHAEAMCPLLSDMQLGTCITPEAVANLGGHDWDSMRACVREWVERTLVVLEIQRSDHPVTALKLFGLGDYIEGENIYKGQAWYLDRNLQRQLVEGSHVFAQAIGDLVRRGEFNEVDLYMVPGNHGRLGRPGEIQANADDLFIDFLEFAFRENPHINVHHSTSPLMGIQLFKRWNILLTHGNETVMWNQIPWYGLNRDALKQQAMARIPIHYKFCGHFHQEGTFRVSADMTVMLNGSWPGPTPFSVTQLKQALPPVQWVTFIHPTVGRTALYDIRLGELPRWEVDSSGLYTPVFPRLGELKE